jgi:hypothetical protein
MTAGTSTRGVTPARPRMVHRLVALQGSDLRVVPPVNSKGMTPHAHEVRAVDALEAFCESTAYAQERRPFAAQSRDEPAPYSCPAKITSGLPLLMGHGRLEDRGLLPSGPSV